MGKEKRTKFFSICKIHSCPLYTFVLQNSIRINVTTLEDDGEVSKEQVCFLLIVLYIL
jgi:hypothetical protein